MSVNLPLDGPDRGLVLAQPTTAAKHRKKHPAVRLYAARFIGPWEGFLPDAYLDTLASPDVWTIGFGHTGDVHAGEHWTKEHAEKVLAHDIGWASAAVVQKVKHRLSVRQRIALISLVFNCGPGILDGDLLHALNKGEFDRAASIMETMNHAGGVVVEGLTRRRKAEAWMMRHPRKLRRNPHKPTPRHKEKK
jgi:lysozyme